MSPRQPFTGSWPFLALFLLLLSSCGQKPDAKPLPAERAASRPTSRATLSSRMNIGVLGDTTAGFADEPNPQFNKPIRLTPFGPDAVLLADINNDAIRVVYTDGRVKTISGGPTMKGYEEGLPDKARFDGPHGVAMLPDGTMIVGEAANHTIRALDPVIDKSGNTVWLSHLLAGGPGKPGFKDGPALEARFVSPHGIIWSDPWGLVICDIGNARLRVLSEGKVRTIAGGGPGSVQLKYPMDVAADPQGILYLIDAGLHCVFRIEKGKAPVKMTLERDLKTPHGIAVAPGGDLIVAEMGAHQVVRIDVNSGAITVLLGNGQAGSSAGELNKPAAVLVHAGRLWIADLENHQVKWLPWPVR